MIKCLYRQCTIDDKHATRRRQKHLEAAHMDLAFASEEQSDAANMKMQLELARSMSYYASLKLNLPAPKRRAALARAQFQLGNSMRIVGQQAIQFHGGIGVTDEHMISHYFKRLTQMEMTFGDTIHHLGEVAGRMQDSAGVFA